MSSRTHAPIALVGTALLALAACAAMNDGATSSLQALGLHVFAGRGYVVRSDQGWQAEFPGVPAGALRELGSGSRAMAVTELELRAEADSRGYRLRVYDGRALDAGEREQVRAMAERSTSSWGRVREPRIVREGGLEIHEVVISELTVNPEHDALQRTFVLGGFIVAAIVIAAQGAGDPSDARSFFASIRLHET